MEQALPMLAVQDVLLQEPYVTDMVRDSRSSNKSDRVSS